MTKNAKAAILLFYLTLSLFSMEFILKLNSSDNIFSSSIIFLFVFSLCLTMGIFIFASFFKGKFQWIIIFIALFFLGILFSSQLIYYKFFKTFYTLYSAGNSEQIFEFWKDILNVTVKNLYWVIILLIPSILIIILRKKFFDSNKIGWGFRSLIFILLLIFHGSTVAGIYFGSKGQNSAYDLYFDSNLPLLSVNKLGLITTMRLEVQRLATGWSPTLKDDFLDFGSIYPLDPNDDPLLGQVDETTEKPIEYNTMEIDFDKLISEEKNEVIKNMHTYFKNMQASKKNEYTGKYKGYNLIFITAEAFSSYAVIPDVTPTLYKMVNEGYKFTNFYNPLWGVSTSDGEYVASTSLLPKSGVWSFYKSANNYMPFAMGNQLKKLNYSTNAYHNHTYTYYRRDLSHPNMGYDYKAVGHGLTVKNTWPESDLEMMEKTVHEYIGNEPFHAYYMTVSGHMLYSFTGNSMANKNKQYVKDLPYSEPAKAYLATQIELDRALEYLLNELEKAGLAENTLIALSPDHYPYGLEHAEIEELAGHPVEKNFELYKSTFILYAKGMTPETIDKPISSLDIIPTLSNLLGLEFDSRLLMGTDVFSDSEPLVIFLNKSFITSKGRYNSVTGKFTPNPGVNADNSYVKNISTLVDSKFYYSTKILETDYYRKVLQ